MQKLLELIRSQQFRHYAYLVAVAVTAILVTYGILSSEQAAVWVGLASAILGLSTAARWSGSTVEVIRRGRHAREDTKDDTSYLEPEENI